MYNTNEELFKLQIFQHTISTIYMYPLRIYNNNCYTQFKELISSSDLEIIAQELNSNSSTIDFDATIHSLKTIIKDNPTKIDVTSKRYKILEKYENRLRDIIWKTQASNSLAFVREVKGDKRLWMFLMLYDLFSKDFIDKNFNEPYIYNCLLDMQSIYIKLDNNFSLSIGRFFTTTSNKNEIIKNILENYNSDNMNIFELITLSEKRREIDIEKLKDKALNIKRAFSLFSKISSKLPREIDKEELEIISIFIYMLTSKYKKDIDSIRTKNLIIEYKNSEFSVKKHYKKSSEYPKKFNKVLSKFEHNRNILREEYSSRLKSMLSRRYSGFKKDNYSAITELLKHISRRLNADAGCYIKYNLADNKLSMEADYVSDKNNISYKVGIQNYIKEINKGKDIDIVDKSRVLKVVKNYYELENRYDIDNLILKNITKNEILQPIAGKLIQSNIALPVTFRHKLLGVLLIDSFRKGNFTNDDINLMLSISSALSVQIFDQIVEENLSAIMENIPNETELDDEKIKKYFRDLTTYINNIFFSYGIAIWEYNKKEKYFQLKSTTLNIKDIDKCKIKKSSNNIIFKLFDNSGCVELCKVANNDLMSACNPHIYDDRINCARIYAIKDKSKIVGALSIYNRSVEDYKSIDEKSLTSVTKHLLIFFNIINTIKAQKAIIQSEALHEINARFNMIESKTKQLKNLLHFHFKELDRYARYRFSIKLDDINNLITNTRISFDYIANRAHNIKHSNSTDDEVENKYKPIHKSNSKISNLKSIFNELIHAMPFPYNRKMLKINNMINENIDLKIHTLILTDIFQNLFLNAIKYSFQKTAIVCYSKIEGDSIIVGIKNEGALIKRDEMIDIFMYGYRGFYAKEFSEEIDGEVIKYKKSASENLGVGLYKANALVKRVLGGEISLKIKKSNIKDGSINIFEVYIPKKYMI